MTKEDETCGSRSDGLHCVCWYDGSACCACDSDDGAIDCGYNVNDYYPVEE